MLIATGDFPFIAGTRVPLHYYSMLYPYFDSIWRESFSSLSEICMVEKTGRRGIVFTCEDPEVFSQGLVIMHTGFFVVNAWMRGDPFFDRKRYLEYLNEVYRPRMARALRALAEKIRAGDYRGAFEAALDALRVVADTETMNILSGGSVNQLYFEMLYGGIPVTYTNTWRLGEAGADVVKRISGEIYNSVMEEALLVARKLEVVARYAGGSKNTGAGLGEPPEGGAP